MAMSKNVKTYPAYDNDGNGAIFMPAAKLAARINSATTTNLISAPAGNTYSASPKGVYIVAAYVDVAGSSTTCVLGDGTGIQGTNNIFFNTANNGFFYVPFPEPFRCAKNSAVVAVTTGSAVNVWVQLLYMIG